MKKTLLTVLLIGVLLTMLTAVPRNKVVVEIGTGTGCPYCPGAAMGAEDLVDNGHPVAIIEYHNYNANDPFNNPAAAARCSYYGITGYPTARFDGLNPSVGGSNTQSMYSTYLPRVTARMAVPSHFTIVAGGGSTGNDYTITATVEKTETDTNTDLRFHCVVTESDIQYAWQNQPEINYTERLMVPNQNGTVVDFGANTSVSIPLSFTINPSWVIANCELVLFLQNNASKEILQAVKYSLPEIGGAFPVSLDEINFPETYLTGVATVPMTITNFWNITATGTIVSSNPVFGIAPATRIDYTIPPYQSRTFDVTFAPTSVGNQTGDLTITSNMPDYATITIPMTGTGFANAAPVVNNVSFAGIPVVSMDMTGEYTYTDPDADTEGATILQWLRITNGTPAPIDGANAITYHLVQDDIGNQVAFQVTPVDQHGMPGIPVVSTPSPTIEVLPAPQNLTYEIVEAQNVMLNWTAPEHFGGRNFLGYKVYRDGLNVATITNLSITSFFDTYLWDGDYQYWVVSMFSNPVTISGPSNVVNVHIGVSNDDNTVTAVEAMQVYPNPFRDVANVLVSGKANSSVSANVYNTKGQMVTTLKGMTDANGVANMVLESKGNLEAGIYFVTVKSNGKHLTQKIVLMK